MLVKIFVPPTVTCKLVNDIGAEVAGQESNGDFHCESPSAALVEEIKGTIKMPVG